MKKALFFDIDGTLIFHKNNITNIPKKVIKEIERLKDLGYYLFLATGRPKAFLEQEILDIGFNGLVLCNGAYVEVNNQIIYEKPMEYQKLCKLINLLDEHNIQYDLETSTYCYFDKNFVELAEFFKKFGINESYLVFDFNKEEIMKRTLKIELNTLEHYSFKIENLIRKDFAYDNHGTQNSYEIFAKEVTKASGIQKVLDYLDIPIENSYAFGDGLNDIEMIKYVRNGVAMGNACKELKEVADVICEDIANDGLGKYLQTID